MKNLKFKTIRTSELLKRLMILLFVMLIYRLGNSVPLLGVELNQSLNNEWSAQSIITGILSGSNSHQTWMGLGLMPYINASIIVNFVVLSKSQEKKERVTSKRVEFFTGLLNFILSFFWALSLSRSMVYTSTMFNGTIMRFFVIGQLLVGNAILFGVLWLNKRYGIAGTTPIIFFNIIRNQIDIIYKNGLAGNTIIVTFGIAVVIIVLIFELRIIKIPVQRVSIHNIHADKNYLAFKLNPVGMMPVMFATAVFMVTKIFIEFLHDSFPHNHNLSTLNANYVMTKTTGAYAFVIIIMILAVGFSYVILSPTDVARNLMKSGDSIVDVPSGIETRTYLRKKILLLSLHSGFVEGLCMGISLWLVITNRVPETAAMIPMNLMLLTSFVVQIVQELRAYYLYDAYSFFL